MAVVTVNNKLVDIGNERMNVIQAALKGGVFIPHYCWHPALTVVASCRMCLVEVGDMKDGKPAMQPKVVPACQTPAKDGTVIVTDSAKAKAAQAQTLEGLLLNHPLDCPVCDKAGECKLQDFSYEYGNSKSRMIDVKNTPPNKPHISSKITLFTDRCIMCTRCVRFTRPLARQDGQLVPTTWATVLPELRQKLAGAGSIAGVISPFLTCEEAFLFAKCLKGLSRDVRLYLGPVPVVGQDDTYPKDRR